jgi:hypothetical protein
MIFITKSKNVAVLADFTKYCKKNPELRFWQALRNWSENEAILTQNKDEENGEFILQDTFYWEHKDR